MDWRRAELIDRAGEAPSVRELFEAVSSRLRRLVSFDAAVWLATDPATGLPTAPARSENMRHACKGSEDCMRVWENEFLVEDVNLYRDLARAETPAAGLRLATDDKPGAQRPLSRLHAAQRIRRRAARRAARRRRRVGVDRLARAAAVDTRARAAGAC